MKSSIASITTARRGYLVLFLLFMFQTLNFFDKLVYGLSAVPLMQEMHLSPKEFGLIGSSFFLLFSLTGTLVGLFVIGRITTKWILVALALVWSASQLPIFFTESIAVLVFCRVLLGAGEGPGLPTAVHAAFDWFPKERRGLPSAVILQGISAGFLIGGPFLTAVIVHFGWRYGFLTCGVLGLVWLAAWLRFGGEGPYAATVDTAALERERLVPNRMLWLDPTIVGVMIMSFMSYWVVGMSAIWLPPYLRVGLGYGAVPTGWIISAVFAFQSPLLLAGAWLCQKMLRSGLSGRASLSHTSTGALLIAGLALLGAINTGGALQLVLIAVAFATPSLTTVFGPMILGNVAPTAQRGKLVVVIYSANALAGLLSTYATGWVIDAAGGNQQMGYANGMMLAAAMLLVGAVANLLLVHPDRAAERFARGAVIPSTRTLEVQS